MSDRKPLTVGLIGVPRIEKRRLQMAFEYSVNRPISYVEADLQSLPRILITNTDQALSLIRWRSYRNKLSLQGHTEPPSVLILKQHKFITKHYQIKRPLIISRVISVLDKVAYEALDVSSEIAIVGESKSTISTDATKNNHKNAVLVVDDSLPVRVQMEHVLKPLASHIDLVESGEQAIKLVNDNHYDVIFLDIVLPGIDGYETCKKIKAGNGKDTPVILLTGNTSPADRIKGKLSGCDTYIIKPINQMVFQEIIHQYFHKDAPPTDFQAMKQNIIFS